MKLSRLIKKITFVLPSLILLLTFVFLLLGFIHIYCFFIGICLLSMITLLEYIFVSIFEKKKLNIETPDNYDEPFHPSVCYTGSKGWNGYRYWMAFTPYPIHSEVYRDRFECPCVVASNDGLQWKYPLYKEHIDDLTDEQIQEMDYFSDPELVMCNGFLYMYYRLSVGGIGLSQKTVHVYRKRTKDGVTWSERENIHFKINSSNFAVISPTIIYEDNKFLLWFVSGEKFHRKVYRMISNDGITWDNLLECNLQEYRYDPWHIDCKHNGNNYYLTIYDMTEKLVVLESNDGISFDVLKTVLVPSKRIYSFYRSTLYRASLCYDENEYKLYFSAGDESKHAIGLMTGTTLDKLKVKSGSLYKFKTFLTKWIEKYLYPYNVVFKKVKGIICHN